MQKITPNLWFDNQAEEAANYYCSIFRNSRIKDVMRYGDSGAEVSGQPRGSVMTITFELDGQEFTGINGGPIFKFNEAVSLLVNCKTQQEIDELWEKLSQGGQTQPCGWLKDKYGLSWQIAPAAELLPGRDPRKFESMMKAMLQMKKINIKELQQAYEVG